ncbi:MAG: 4-coumarate--CoA ligase family protein [Proteobacteria bacterium]|nr:4-coumarate--CoA ligase family protein [Pseudomonadota bacterium]MCP4917824.1 4-coumarate--CoA ligase family protein [Pseudomonadota bacterium]
MHTSTHSAPDYPDVSVTEYVLRHAERLADKPAFIEGGSGRVVTYAALADRIRSLAGGLQARGVGVGTTWAVMAPNVPEYAVVFHGLAYAGATVTTLNPTYGAEEIAQQLGDSGATAIVTVELFLETARAAAEQVGIETVVVIGPGDATPLSELFGTPLASQVAVDCADHVVALPYSSGTTGFPKGVMLTHRNLVANLVQTENHLPLDEDEVAYAVLPFFHIYGMQILMNYMLSVGLTVVTVPRFDLVQMLELTQKHRITRLYLVPPIVLALAKHPIIDSYDLSSVRQIFSGAAPLGGEVAEAASARLGCSMAQGYGMTELSPVTHAVREGDYKAGSVGTLIADTEARIVDPDTGRDVDEGEPGEIWVRGPQVMKGYLNNPQATAATIDPDGWLHTGDIGQRDDDGHFFIVDRLKELIKVKGFQVPPAELEALLLTHPGIADAAVIGIPDDESGELPKAFVVRSDDALDEDAVMAFVAARVSTYKRVRLVEFMDAIPKSASGKILRRVLREA